jgi:hypothetical protein
LQIPNSLNTLKQVLQSGINGTHALLQVSDLDWNTRLAKIEQEYQDRHTLNTTTTNTTKINNNDESDSVHSSSSKGEESDTATTAVVDVLMFAKMFRTAMEILEHSGQSP